MKGRRVDQYFAISCHTMENGCQMQAMCLKRELQTPGKRVYRDDSDGAKVSENPPVAGRYGSNLGQMVGTLEIGDF